MSSWEDLRLTDRVEPGVEVLFVGINPGVKSAETGHHFAGPSNRFWKLLWESRLLPEPLPIAKTPGCRSGLGITNLVARPSPGIDTLKPSEYRGRVDRPRSQDRRVQTEGRRPRRCDAMARDPAAATVAGRRAKTIGEIPLSRPAARNHPRRTSLRPAQSERPQRKFQLRRNARRLPCSRAIPQEAGELLAGSWELEAGSWELEAGSWKLAAGSWQLLRMHSRSFVSRSLDVFKVQTRDTHAAASSSPLSSPSSSTRLLRPPQEGAIV